MSKHILISRTDAIGDVVLTLPMCGLIKERFSDFQISFLGRGYTKDIVMASEHVDNFIDFNRWLEIDVKHLKEEIRRLKIDVIIHVYPNAKVASIARDAGIKLRIGTTNRIFHWLTCNKLIRLSRKKSQIHESELNIKLLKGIGIEYEQDLNGLHNYYGITKTVPLGEEYYQLLASDKFNLVLHPKSNGSAREWYLDKFTELIKLLPSDKFRVFITGSAKERQILLDWIGILPGNVIDLTGKFTLAELITFLTKVDGLVAASTGPLHIAAAVGIHTLGLYPDTPPMHAGRWGALGRKAENISSEDYSLDSISSLQVYNIIRNWETTRGNLNQY